MLSCYLVQQYNHMIMDMSTWVIFLCAARSSDLFGRFFAQRVNNVESNYMGIYHHGKCETNSRSISHDVSYQTIHLYTSPWYQAVVIKYHYAPMLSSANATQNHINVYHVMDILRDYYIITWWPGQWRRPCKFTWFAPKQMVEPTIERPVIWDAIALFMASL